ncbi:MAG: class I SAM-dependent methyltransferase [Sedimentisphaerales bacterium]|nr:class I SAM-dependent methyltransferase [Sedimentisphaerales bacterium]
MNTAICEKPVKQNNPTHQLQWERVNCNLCGADDTEIYHRERLPYFEQLLDFQIVRCRQCGLVYTNPRLTDHNATYLFGTDFNPKQIEAHAHAKQTVFERALNEIITLYQSNNPNAAAPVENSPPPAPNSPTLLDIGCGSGHFVALARKHNFQASGIEPTPASARYATEILNIPVHIGPIADIELPPQSFDIITAWDVIEHVADPLDVMQRCANWLRPGGILALRFPSSTWQKIKALILHNLLASRRPVFSPTMHLYFFNVRTFTQLAQRVGLTVLKAKTTPAEANTDNLLLNYAKLTSQIFLRTIETAGRTPIGNLEVYCRKLI